MKFVASLLLAFASSAVAFAPTTHSVSSSTRLFEGDDDSNEFKGAAAISALTKDVTAVFTSEDVDGFLPHRYPFALVDKVVEYEAGKKAVGIKCVTKVRYVTTCFIRYSLFQ
jgi:hypothetical protein